MAVWGSACCALLICSPRAGPSLCSRSRFPANLQSADVTNIPFVVVMSK